MRARTLKVLLRRDELVAREARAALAQLRDDLDRTRDRLVTTEGAYGHELETGLAQPMGWLTLAGHAEAARLRARALRAAVMALETEELTVIQTLEDARRTTRTTERMLALIEQRSALILHRKETAALDEAALVRTVAVRSKFGCQGDLEPVDRVAEAQLTR